MASIFKQSILSVVLGTICLAPAFSAPPTLAPENVGGDTPAALYPTELEREDVLKKQDLYHFTVQKYTTPVMVDRIADAKAPALAHRAEAVAKAHFAAMIKGDYQLWLSLWDIKSKKSLMNKAVTKGQDEQFWQSLWWRAFGEYDAFALTRRVDTGHYVIIEMTAVDKDGEREPLVTEVPLAAYNTKQGIVYAVTDKLDEDPVFKHWRKAKPTLSRHIR